MEKNMHLNILQEKIRLPFKRFYIIFLMLLPAIPLYSQVLMLQQDHCRQGDSLIALVYPYSGQQKNLEITYADGSILEIPGIPYPVESLGRGLLAFIPIPPDSIAGTAQLSWQDQSIELQIESRNFPHLRIPLSEAPEPMAAGDNRLYRQLARFNEEQQHWQGEKFRKPLDSFKLISSSYGERRTFTRAGRSWNEIHQGIDFAQNRGTPVYAPTDGRVVISEFLNSPGNLVVVEFFPGMYQLFYHLDSRTVNRGDLIKQGDLVGYVGSTGKSTGPHLHFEIRCHAIYVDPQPYLDGAFPLNRLLPSMVQRKLTGLRP